MVVVRMGENANNSVLAWSEFDNELWQRLDSLGCTVSSVNEIEGAKLSVYPNPSSDVVTVNFSNGEYNLQLTDMQGRVVYAYGKCSGTHSIDVSALPAGVYTLMCENGNQKNYRR